MSRRPGVVVYQAGAGLDAIDVCSHRLVAALRAAGSPVRYEPGGLRRVRETASVPAWLVLQYMPFSFGRWGFAPGVLRHVIALRRARRTRVTVLVHEAWCPIADWRSALMGGWQRAQLRALAALADVVMVANQAHGAALRRPTVHVPLGSNIAMAESTWAAERDRRGVARETFVVALLGGGHPSRALDHAEAAIAALARERGAGTLRILNLGLGAPALRLPAGVASERPGYLEDDELSRLIRMSDLMLLPFRDGLSTRRSTLMAALEHGVPVAGLRGTHTDAVLADAAGALVLTASGDAPAYVRAVVALARDPARLRAVGEHGRDLYRREFDWPVVARRVAGALDS